MLLSTLWTASCRFPTITLKALPNYRACAAGGRLHGKCVKHEVDSAQSEVGTPVAPAVNTDKPLFILPLVSVARLRD